MVYRFMARAYRILLIGEATVGKTTLLNSFINRSYSEDYKISLGADLYIIRDPYFRIGYNDELPKDVVIHFIDVSSSMKYSSYGHVLYERADLFILVYDIASRDSLQKLYEWMAIFSKSSDAPRILCGNKRDKFETLEIVELEREAYVKIFKAINSYEVSSLTLEGVDDLFNDAILACVKKDIKESSEKDE